ncbi:MAG: alpha/beta fold hydrolase [bacterium]
MAAGDKKEIERQEFRLDVNGTLIAGSRFALEGVSSLPVLIILHGIPRSKPQPGDRSYNVIAERFARQGFLSVIFNFRGTGASGGDLSMAGWAEDLFAVIEYSRGLERADPDRVALMGFSAGGALAIYAAAHDPGIKAVVSGSSPAEFSFLEDTMPAGGWIKLFKQIGLIRSEDFPRSPEDWQKEFQTVAPRKWIDKVSPRPVLLLHGEEDEVIPFEQAKALYEKAGEPKELLPLPGGKHRLRVEEHALQIAEDWLVRFRDGSG